MPAAAVTRSPRASCGSRSLPRPAARNRQIAQALFVTQRTVENHLTSAYAKLGITARPELAAVLAPEGPSQARRTAPTSR